MQKSNRFGMLSLLSMATAAFASANMFAVENDGVGSTAVANPNPTPAAKDADLTQIAEPTYPQETKFRFNSQKDETTGAVTQRPAVTVNVPVPTLQGLIAVIQDGAKADANTEEGKKKRKALDYLLQVTGDAVVKEVRGYVSDNVNAAQNTIPWDKFTFEAIANMPAGIRGASSIPKELWEKFVKSYVAVISSTGVAAEMAAVRASVLVNKFRPLTGNPDRKTIIENLMGTIAVYLEKAPASDTEEFSAILEFLDKKATELKEESTVVTANALGFA